MTSSFNDELNTRLVHGLQADPTEFNALSTPIYKGSSLFFDNTAAQRAMPDMGGLDYSYGLHGNPTQYTLGLRLADIEGAPHCVLCPSGLNAIVLVAQAVLKTGDHWLIPDNVYNPVQVLARQMQVDSGIAFTEYDPMNLDELASKIQPNTRLLWAEAPGSITFEVPHLGNLVQTAKQHGLVTAIDNTWSAGIAFKPFQHGFDYSIQALTKYQCGHADVLMGAVLSANATLHQHIVLRRRISGVGVSPYDCEQVLRGLLTLPLRYKTQGEAGLRIAQWLQQQPEVHRVLHPALPDCPGHAHFSEFFAGQASVFSVVFKAPFKDQAACKFVDALRLFRIAYSWGGPESLALAGDLPADRAAKTLQGGGSLVRLAIGLEAEADLIMDLRQALNHMVGVA